MLGIIAGMDQKDSCCGMCKAGYAGYVTPGAVFSSLVHRNMMFGIMVGMVQKEIFALFFDPSRDAEVFSHGPDCSSDH